MKLLLTLTALLFAITTHASIRGSPYMPETDQRFSDIEARALALEPAAQATNYAADGLLAVKVARATIDCSTAANCTVGAHSLGQALPAKAMIIRSYYYSAVQPVSAGSGSIAVHCEDANNIVTAANLTSKTVGTISEGGSTGATTAMVVGIASACNITATITSSDYTAGKLNIYTHYVVND